MIKTDLPILKKRLIQRKIQGGLSLEAVTAFYEKSDSYNVLRILNNSDFADETWQMLDDNDYIIFHEGGEK